MLHLVSPALVLDAAHELGGGDDGVSLRPAAQAGHVEGGLTEVVRVDGVDRLVGPVQTDGQVGTVDGQEDFLPSSPSLALFLLWVPLESSSSYYSSQAESTLM